MRMLCCTALALLAAPLLGRAADAKPGDLPIKAKLVAKTTTFTLDLGGKTAEEFRKLLKDGEKTGKLPMAPVVEIELELTNTSAKDVVFWKNGDPVSLTLELKGTGAVSVKPMLAFTANFAVPSPMVLAAGKTYTIKIGSLRYGFRGIAESAYWTEPGEYTLKAGFVTAVNPAPEGTKPDREGFGKVTLTSEPIKIKVEKK